MKFDKNNKLSLGRPKGTLNKATSEVRESLQQLIEGNLHTLQSDLDLLEPKDRLNVMIQLCKFVVPTLKAIDIQENNNNDFTPIVFSFSE